MKLEPNPRFWFLHAVAAGVCMAVGYTIIKSNNTSLYGWVLWLIGVANLGAMWKVVRK